MDKNKWSCSNANSITKVMAMKHEVVWHKITITDKPAILEYSTCKTYYWYYKLQIKI